jgi:hypothetical protein
VGYGSCFHVLRQDSFSAVQRASGPVLRFYKPGLIFDGTEDVESLYHDLRSLTHFRRYRGRRVSFSCFACWTYFWQYRGRLIPFSCFPLLDMFSSPEGVRSYFHVLRSRTRFQGYQGRRVPFSYFACPDLFSAKPRASGPVFKFCVAGLVSRGTEGVGSRFHVLRAGTSFWRYRGRRVPFSCFARPDSFSAVPTVSGPFFWFN